MAAFREVIGPSRAIEGVASFDIGRDLTDPDSFIAFEVFEDMVAVGRQEAQPQVQQIISQLEEMVVAEPEATIFYVTDSEPWGT